MKEARAQEEANGGDFVSLFINAYHKSAPGHKLAEVFATQQLQGKVSPQSSDAEVEKAIRASVQDAIDNSFNVVRTRIDKFGVVQPNIQKLEGQQGRIMVEMPGISQPERMRKMLQGSANLEFWETYNSEEIAPYLQQLDTRIAMVIMVRKRKTLLLLIQLLQRKKLLRLSLRRLRLSSLSRRRTMLQAR